MSKDEEAAGLIQKLTTSNDKAKAAILAESGLIKFQAVDFDSCIRDSSEAIKLDSTNPHNFSLRGFAYRSKNMLDDALRDFTEAIRLGSTDLLTIVSRGRIYVEKGLLDKAISDFSYAISLNPDASTYRLRGICYSSKGFMEPAISDLSEAISLEPENANSYLCRGFCYQQIGNFRSAIADCQIYLLLSNDDGFRDDITALIAGWSAKLDSRDSQIVDEDSSKPTSSSIETWMHMGKAAFENGFYLEAAEHFDNVLKKDPTNWEAIIYRTRELGLHTTLKNESWNEFFEIMNDFKGQIQNAFTGAKRKEALLLIAESVYTYTELYMDLINERRNKKTYDFENQSNMNEMIENWNLIIRGLNRIEESVDFLENMDDAVSDALKLKIKKSTLKWITALCEPIKIKMKSAMDGFAYVGQNDDMRARYITTYDSLLDEIKRVEPDFEPDSLIDRLSAPISKQEAAARPNVLKKMQIQVEKARQLREAENQKQKYWETHLDEYTAHLAEEKRKIEKQKDLANARKQRKIEEQKAQVSAEKDRKKNRFEERKQILQKEISECDIKLEEMKRESGRELERLRKERESLGFLAFSKKKGIDQKVLSLETQLSDFAATVDSLRKQLKELKP